MIEIILFVILGLSIFPPLYTYALYPLILTFFRQKMYKVDNIMPFISVIICFGKGNDEWKKNNIMSLNYSNIEIIESKNINEAIDIAKGEVLVFVDNETELDRNALVNIVKPFSDKRIDLVVGEQICKEGNSFFWKYETKVKKLESRIGSVSGANNALFAIRKTKSFIIPSKVKNIPFYCSTLVQQNKGDVVYCSEAKTYEKKSEGVSFKHHIVEASSYWQAFVIFWRMLLFRKGSFVYVSHRVMKWFVWLDFLSIIITLLFLSRYNFVYLYVLIGFFSLGVIAFLIDSFIKKGAIKRIAKIINYFVLINLSYFFGLFVRD